MTPSTPLRPVARFAARLAVPLAAVALAACASTGAGDGDHGSPVDMLGSMDQEEFMALHELSEAEVPELRGRAQRVPVEGRGDMLGYLSLPPGADGPLPGVLVIHEWWGRCFES